MKAFIEMFVGVSIGAVIVLSIIVMTCLVIEWARWPLILWGILFIVAVRTLRVMN